MHSILTLFVATENHSFRARTPKPARASTRTADRFATCRPAPCLVSIHRAGRV